MKSQRFFTILNDKDNDNFYKYAALADPQNRERRMGRRRERIELGEIEFCAENNVKSDAINSGELVGGGDLKEVTQSPSRSL